MSLKNALPVLVFFFRGTNGTKAFYIYLWLSQESNDNDGADDNGDARALFEAVSYLL